MPPKRYVKKFSNFQRASSRGRTPARKSNNYASRYPAKAPYVKKPYVKSKVNYGTEVGRLLGGFAGVPGVGAALGKQIASVFGHGDYSIATQQHGMKLMSGDTPPQFGNSGRKVRLQHREYITDVFSSSTANTFLINPSCSLAINPGVTGSFPWLSSVAANFECYNLKGMLYEYKTTSADALNSVNTALGTVIMATSYNSANQSFLNKQQMENYEFAQSCKPSESMCHYIECAKGSKPLDDLYIRVGAVPTGQTPQMYDVGYFNLATTGFQGTSVNCGELWVTYDIELSKPKLQPGGAAESTAGYAHWTLGAASGTNFFANAVQVANTFGAELTGGTINTQITFNSPVSSVFLVLWNIYGTGAAAPAYPSTIVYVNSGGVKLWSSGTVTSLGTASTEAFQYATAVQMSSQSGDQFITFTGQVNPTVVNGGDLFIIQLPANAA